MSLSTSLAAMPSVSELFRLFLSGKHLNRVAEPALWCELETHEEAYRSLFKALGYDLRIDTRGFAWFHTQEAQSTVSKTSRQLALLFMVIFDAQANAGKPLLRFGEWLINREWLEEIHKHQQEVLLAEGISPDELVELLNRATTLGFAMSEPSGWRLLPSVFRYLDHFESLIQAAEDEQEEADNFMEADPPIEAADDEEDF